MQRRLSDINIFLKYDSPIRYIDSGKLSIYNDWAHLPVSSSASTLLYVFKGSLYLSCDDKRHEVTAGDIFIVPPDTPYSSYKPSKAPLSFFWCRFSMSEVSSGAKYKLKNHLNAGSSYLAASLIKELSSEIESRGCEEYASFLLTTLLYSFVNNNCKIEQSSPDSFAKVLDYIDENLSSPIGASQVASHFGYNPAYFSRLFMKKTGLSPMEYIKRQRIHLAKEMLIRPYDSISDIGASCGYPDEKYFSRLFKKSEGMTPTQYRKLNSPDYGK